MMFLQYIGFCEIALGGAVLVVVVTVCMYHYKVKQLKEQYTHWEEDFHKAEAELDIKNEFIKNLANDLREPLNPISGFSDILTSEELMPEERKAMGEHIKESSKVLAVLIDSMAELSFYECKKSLPINASVSPNAFCQHMVDAYKGKCQQGVEMLFETSISDKVEMKTNFEAFKRLIELLIVNAIKYTEKGNITLACSQKDQKILTLDSLQSTTSEDVKNGVTYLSVMKDNLEVLKEALQ